VITVKALSPVALAAVVVMLAAAPPVSAHGVAPDPGSFIDVLLAWQLEAHVILPILLAGLL
jgi:hypothetical protein